MPSLDPFFHESLHRLRDYRLFLPNPTFGNGPWESADFRVLVVRLSPFSDVERSSPHLFLAQETREALPEGYIDMAFLPEAADARTLRGAGLPLLVGTQSHRPLADFDLVLVSNSWLLEQVNLPFLLLGSGIPVWAQERGEQWPALIVGGSSATAAHALVSEQGHSIADAIFFGEGEGKAAAIVAMSRSLRSMPKAARLAAIAHKVDGLWPAGSLGTRVRRASCSDDDGSSARFPILPGPESATARLPVTRGCPCLCSFCFEGHDRKPFRQVPARRALQEARRLKMESGASTVEIESFNFNTHTELADLLLGLNRLFSRVNMMSQRVDILARTPGLLDLEIMADKSSFTLGIEGISDRMRRFLSKGLRQKDIRQVLEALHARRTRELKLFYILCGRETGSDFEEFAASLAWLKEVRLRSASQPRIVFSFGMLVRMPFTPLRHDPPLFEETEWRPLIGRAKSICETNGFEFRLAMSWTQYRATQALALGGHSLHSLLLELAGEGCIDEKGLPGSGPARVDQWLAAHGGAIEKEKPPGYPFPFPFLDDEGVRGALHRQYENAKAGIDQGYCRLGEEGTDACADCPGCTRGARRSPYVPVAAAAVQELGPLMARKRRLVPVAVTARIPREAAGFGKEWREAWMMRALLQERPDQIENVLAVKEILPEAAGVLGADVPWFGETVVALTAWDADALRSLLPLGNAFGPVRDGAEPEVFRSMRLTLTLPRRWFSDAPSRLAAFLRDAHAPVTISRSGDALKLEAHEKALKRKMLLAGRCEETREDYRLDLVIGPKMDLGGWLRSFDEPGAERRALAEICEIE
jgi:hypothetical protein